MSRKRTEKWLLLVALVIGMIPVLLMGFRAYIKATAIPLHPNIQNIPSVRPSTPSPRWAEAAEQARQVVRAALNEQNLPGLSVAVGVDGEIAWVEGFGWADLERQVPVSPDMPFRIGTASMVLTSTAVGLLHDEGALAFDDPIQKYVPAFPSQPWPVTIRQLMGHLSGLRNDGGDEGPLLSRHCQTPLDGLDVFKDSPLLFEPGTAYRFSSYAWILVSAAIEAAAGARFQDVMESEVFAPLGMRDTSARAAPPSGPTRLVAYFPRLAADPRYGLHLLRPIDHSCYAGASAFLSTPSDMVRFGMGITSGALLQPATVRLLQTPQKLASGEETGYGLGWNLESVSLAGKQTRWVGHDGTVLGGRVASLITVPEHGLAISVMSNISYADTEGIAVQIAQVFAR